MACFIASYIALLTRGRASWYVHVLTTILSSLLSITPPVIGLSPV